MVRSKEQTKTSSIDDHRIARLTGLIYDTVQAPGRWPKVLKVMADTLGAKSGLVRHSRPARRALRAREPAPAQSRPETLQAEYRASLVGEDPVRARS
ncbi:MAG: hypothetical protein U5K33_01485 [Halofilum sp. (in: g-proteobacteria)]|nr:hypothetical protein [Halofilum sp. (in: g-proteobacteria)]